MRVRSWRVANKFAATVAKADFVDVGANLFANDSMMKKYRLIKIIFLSLLVVALAGCETQKGRTPSPDWSRGLPLGSSGRGSIGMAVADDSGRVHLTWPDVSGGEPAIRYMQLDGEANPSIDTHLPLPDGEKRTPRLALADGENVHFLWVFRGEGDPNWILYYTQIDQNGEFLHNPIPLSDEEVRVGSYRITPDNDGGLFAVWEVGDDIYLTHLTATGVMDIDSLLFIENGSEPALRVDGDDGLHFIWREADQIMYAQLDAANPQRAAGVMVVDVDLSSGAVMAGPVLGLSDEWGYIIWSVANRTGMEAGTARVEYVSFPIGELVEDQKSRLGLSAAEDLPYEAYAGDYQMTLLAAASPIPYSSDFAHQPAVDQGQAGEVAVVLAMTQQLRQKSVMQVATAVFKDGAFLGFNMTGKTDAFSQEPFVASDTAGNLHVAWREGGHGQMIFYATTAPDARDAINGLDFGDISNLVFTGGIEAAVGMMMFPLAFIWVLPGLLIMGIWHMRRDEDTLSDPITLILLLISLISYQFIKVSFWPFMMIYVPFSAWIDVPDSMNQLLQIGVPIVIFGIGLLTAVYIRKRKNPYMSGLLFFFITTTIDGLLSLGVYGVNFLGVF